MLRHFTKLAQPAREWDRSDQDNGSAVEKRVAENIATPKSSSSAAVPSALDKRDLRISFNLLYQAIIRFSDPKLNASPKLGASQPAADTRALDDMRRKLVACESEKLQLKSDLEYAHQCAHAYWDRCKSLEAELVHLNGGAAVTALSRARSTRGVP
jgi:hypothetical protein